MPDGKRGLQALTLRIPEEDYQLLRALAFAEDRSLNDLVLQGVQALIDEQRPQLKEILARARDARRTQGQPADLPRNPHGKGRRPRTPRTEAGRDATT
ncbi:MAG: hypothetical protein ACR2MZ_14875 [Candidatus Dormibacter sp.]|uniref:hypothetical protein n=1 Tax=Candidatus Dormibacter sp. TaxID=2973982 RepID=UPI003D9B17FD